VVASLGILVGSITEGVDGLVVTLGNADYLLTIVEGTTGSDVVLRRLQWELIDTSETTNWQTINTSETTNWQTINTSETTNWQTIPTIN
jgi:hypothetical protein